MLILTHTLFVKNSAGETPVEIRIYKPKQAGSHHWTCDFEINWPDRTTHFKGSGHDALQALTLTLQLIGVQLYTSAYHQQSRLRAYDKEQGYGFPVTSNLRDLLIGADKAAF